MNHLTELKDYSDIYDAVQMGVIPAKMGDTINGEFLMVNGFHLEPFADGPFYLFTDTIKNHSTGRTFEEKYVSREHPGGFSPETKHLEILSTTKEEIVIG